MSFFDSLERFADDLLKKLSPKEVVKLKSCKNCRYFKKGYCTQPTVPSRILSEYWAQGCLYYTTEEPVVGEDVTGLAKESKQDTIKTEIETVKNDIEAMKDALGTLGVMRTAQVIERKGGGASINTFSTDEEVSTNSTTYVLKREFDISTPTPPSGMTVYKYALMVSVELKRVGATTGLGARIDVDGETMAEITTDAFTTEYTWFDRAKEVTAGSHNVKIYLKGYNSNWAYLKGTRGNCGVGTIGTTETKVATIETAGDSKLSYIVAGKAYESATTVTGTGKADGSEADKVSIDAEVIADGSKYSNYTSLASFVFTHSEVWGMTTEATVACFIEWMESRSLQAVTP